jgi:hypothetical protein
MSQLFYIYLIIICQVVAEGQVFSQNESHNGKELSWNVSFYKENPEYIQVDINASRIGLNMEIGTIEIIVKYYNSDETFSKLDTIEFNNLGSRLRKKEVINSGTLHQLYFKHRLANTGLRHPIAVTGVSLKYNIWERGTAYNRSPPLLLAKFDSNFFSPKDTRKDSTQGFKRFNGSFKVYIDGELINEIIVIRNNQAVIAAASMARKMDDCSDILRCGYGLEILINDNHIIIEFPNDKTFYHYVNAFYRIDGFISSKNIAVITGSALISEYDPNPVSFYAVKL